MLSKRPYNRQELIDLYKTNRIDAIKNRLLRSGYIYTETGRGKDLIITIIDLPKERMFERYCIDQLGFTPQTDFNTLKLFIYNLLNNEEFAGLQFNEMVEELKKQGVNTSAQTLSKYFDHLRNRGWIFVDAFNYKYYVFDNSIGHNIYITKDEYRQMYKDFWITVRKDCGNFKRAEANIREKYGNKPRKRPENLLNGIYTKQFNEIQTILEKEFEE